MEYKCKSCSQEFEMEYGDVVEMSFICTHCGQEYSDTLVNGELVIHKTVNVGRTETAIDCGERWNGGFRKA